MRNQDIIKELQQLRNTKANEDWKNSFRDILFCQINSQKKEKKSFFRYLKYPALVEVLFPQRLKQVLIRPVGIAVLSLVVIFSGGVFSVNASKSSLPGDVLYKVKLTSEKVKITLTPANEKKVDLHLENVNTRLFEMEEIIKKETERPKKKHAVSEAFKGITQEMHSLKDKLDEMNQEEKSEVAMSSAKKVEEKINSEVISKLKQNEASIKAEATESPEDDQELAQLVKESLKASKEVKTKAVEVMVDKYVEGSVPQEDVELVLKAIAKQIDESKADLSEVQKTVEEKNKQKVEQEKADSEEKPEAQPVEEASPTEETENQNQADENETEEVEEEQTETNNNEIASEPAQTQEGGSIATEQTEKTEEETSGEETMLESAEAPIAEAERSPEEADKAFQEAKELLELGNLESAFKKAQEGSAITEEIAESINSETYNQVPVAEEEKSDTTDN